MGHIARHNDNVADLGRLRERISVLEQYAAGKISTDSQTVFPLGVPEFDSVLPQGGLKLAGLHEVITASDQNFSAFPGVSGASTGFAAWLVKKSLQHRPGLALWCRRATSRFDPQPYGPGLLPWLDPTRLLLVEARQQADVLWALEEGLHCKGVTTVLGEIGSADLTATRRLLLAAESSGSMALLLRPQSAATSSAALTRWQVAAAPARSTEGLRDIAHPHWRVELRRARGVLLNDAQSSFLMEWNDETGDLAVAASPLDRSAGAPRPAMARPAGGDSGFGFRRTAAGLG
jgi:protein ImuA